MKQQTRKPFLFLLCVLYMALALTSTALAAPSAESAMEAARRALVDTYGQTPEQAQQLVLVDLGVVPAQEGAHQYFMFKKEDTPARHDWLFAVAVSLQDGQVKTTYNRATWAEDLKAFAAAYPNMTEGERSMYITLHSSDASGRVFWAWPPEQKAQFSQAIKPLADKVLQQDPQYSGAEINYTRSAYGTPGADDIPYEKALHTALNVLKPQTKAKDGSDIESWPDIHAEFDVTSPTRPVWRFNFFPDMTKMVQVEKGMLLGATCVLDGRSGQVLESGASRYEQ